MGSKDLAEMQRQRKRKTSLAIDKAFQHLKSKGRMFDLKELTKLAGIDRTTLYRHPEKLEMIRQYLEELEKSIRKCN